MRSILLGAMILIAYACSAAEALPPPDFKSKVMQAIGKPSPKWKEVRLEESKSNTFSFTIVYTTMPNGPKEVETDTKRVGRAALKTLIAAGKNPMRDWTRLAVSAHRPEKGETGAALVRYFGSTVYDWNDDKLVFSPATSKR